MFLNGTFDKCMIHVRCRQWMPTGACAGCLLPVQHWGETAMSSGGFSYSAFISLGAMVQWLLISKVSGPPKSRGLRQLCVAGYHFLLRSIHRSSNRPSELNINKTFRPIKQNMQMNSLSWDLINSQMGTSLPCKISTLSSMWPQWMEQEFALHNPGATREVVFKKYKSVITLLYKMSICRWNILTRNYLSKDHWIALHPALE